MVRVRTATALLQPHCNRTATALQLHGCQAAALCTAGPALPPYAPQVCHTLSVARARLVKCVDLRDLTGISVAEILTSGRPLIAKLGRIIAVIQDYYPELIHKARTSDASRCAHSSRAANARTQAGCNRTHPRLQSHAPQAATLHVPGCNPHPFQAADRTHSRLKPAPIPGCNPHPFQAATRTHSRLQTAPIPGVHLQRLAGLLAALRAGDPHAQRAHEGQGGRLPLGRLLRRRGCKARGARRMVVALAGHGRARLLGAARGPRHGRVRSPLAGGGTAPPVETAALVA